jgi:hypothetical protein
MVLGIQYIGGEVIKTSYVVVILTVISDPEILKVNASSL